MSFCELRSGRNSRLRGYEACLYNLPPLLSASLLSLAFAGRPRLRGGFDLAWECSSLCRPCESLSLSYLLLLFRHPPPLSSIPVLYHFSPRLPPLILIPHPNSFLSAPALGVLPSMLPVIAPFSNHRSFSVTLSSAVRYTVSRTLMASWSATWTSTPTDSTTWPAVGTTVRSSSGMCATSRSRSRPWRSTRTGGWMAGNMFESLTYSLSTLN